MPCVTRERRQQIKANRKVKATVQIGDQLQERDGSRWFNVGLIENADDVNGATLLCRRASNQYRVVRDDGGDLVIVGRVVAA